MASAPVLSTENSFHRVSNNQNVGQVLGDDVFHKVYQIDEVATWISQQGYKTVALQFPDYALIDSARVVELLTRRCKNIDQTAVHEFFVLGDTSYSPCCVDEIAAQHVSADVVIHFGNTCLSEVTSIPVAYVLSDGSLVDIDAAEQKFRTTYSNPETQVVLMSDVQYSRSLDQLFDRIKQDYPNAVLTSFDFDRHCSHSKLFPPPADHDDHTEKNSTLPLRRHQPLKQDLGSYEAFLLMDDSPSPSLMLHLSTLVSKVSVLSISRTKNSSTMAEQRLARSLQKRYKYMNQARVARTIGILVNTLSLKNTNAVLTAVKQWIIAAGKKHYTFVVGKPNVPKLANFEVVDIWVVLGCPLGGLIVNCDDYYRPILTPYELNQALKLEIEWTGSWPIDFDQALSMPVPENDDDKEANPSEDDADAPRFDPISGTYSSTYRPLRRINVEVDSEDTSAPANSETSANALATKFDSQMAIRNTVSTAAEYLHDRPTWKGLGSEWDNTEEDSQGATLKQGRSGIARGYTAGEPDSKRA